MEIFHFKHHCYSVCAAVMEQWSKQTFLLEICATKQLYYMYMKLIPGGTPLNCYSQTTGSILWDNYGCSPDMPLTNFPNITWREEHDFPIIVFSKQCCAISSQDGCLIMSQTLAQAYIKNLGIFRRRELEGAAKLEAWMEEGSVCCSVPKPTKQVSVT